MALGLRMSTPTNILIGESNLLSIHLRSRLLCQNFLRKVFSKTQSETYAAIESRLGDIIDDNRKRIGVLRWCINRVVGVRQEIHHYRLASVNKYDYDMFMSTISVNYEVGRMLASSEYPNEIFQCVFNDTNAIIIFTDGSKDDHGSAAGTACVSPDLEIVRTNSVSPRAFIYTAECVALSDAMDIALKHLNRDFNIFMDSLSAVISMDSRKINANTNHNFLSIIH